MRVSLAYGRAPLVAELPDHAEVVPCPTLGPPSSALAVCRAALGAWRGCARHAVVVVSDATREEPRGELIAAVREAVQADRLTIAVATGTHAPSDALPGVPRDLEVRSHDGHAPDGWVDVGKTRCGTRVRYPRWLCDADLVIATGVIRPHYFAGYGAGAKAIFPGLGQNDDIRANHRLKADPTATLGRVEGNVCRADMEEAARLLPAETFLLNLAGEEAVAGDLVEAHRRGVAICRPRCEVPVAGDADVIVASGPSPVADSLYQASKLLVPAGMMLRPGGVAVLVAECARGTGPLEVVNEAIWKIGVSKFFRDATIYLVSSLPAEIVSRSYCRPAPSVEWVLARHFGRVLVMPDASHLVPIAAKARA